MLDGRAGGGQRGFVASEMNDDEFEEVMVHEIGRSHSGGHIAYEKHLPEGKFSKTIHLPLFKIIF